MIQRIIFILFFIFLLSCKKEEVNQDFTIAILETTPLTINEFQENIFVKIEYYHPQGYVGVFNPDSLSLEIKDSRLLNPDFYHLIPVTPPSQSLSVIGEIQIEIDAPFIFGNGNLETLTYTIRIRDKEQNWSNPVSTPLITVIKP